MIPSDPLLLHPQMILYSLHVQELLQVASTPIRKPPSSLKMVI
jgi:hypothetical protein